MDKTLNHLSELLLAEASLGNDALGALVIVGSAITPQNGNVTSFSGGNTAPIVVGLVREMQRDPGILSAVRMALSIVDQQN